MGLQTTSIKVQHLSYPHYYLCHYLPVSAGRDTLSRSLLKFKHGLQPDLDGWIDCALELLAPVPFRKETIIVRVLHHEETIIREDEPAPPGAPRNQEQDLPSLDLLGQALADRFHCHYQPSLLRKSRITRQNKGLSRAQRQAELNDVYIATGPPISGSAPSADPAPNPPFLIIDDILTTGTTARMIIRAILRHYPLSSLQVFTLAKADHDTTLNFSTPLRGQNYHLEQGTGWQVAEEDQEYYSGEILRKKILANSF